ncbi:MAG: DUF1566 domain-containing protein [Microthrixaceae bacterium]|nr:DUF1566 domain-containing protein [Microthrixaceae bacterium]
MGTSATDHDPACEIDRRGVEPPAVSVTRTRRGRWALIAAVLLLTLTLGGCGEEGATTSQEETNESGASDTTSRAGTFQLTDTGQTTHYDSAGNEIDAPAVGEPFYGQDAAFAGAAMSFTDNGDGTVSDEVTGLLWQQDPTEEGTTWFEAQEYCEDLELAGFSDWRTPSLVELFSISDFSSGWPYLDTGYFALVGDEVSKDQQYWSSNHYDVDTEEAAQNQAFGVNHGTGHIKAYPDGTSNAAGDAGAAESDGVTQGDQGAPPEPPAGAAAPAGGSNPATKYVRCVTGDDYGVNDFVDNGDGTVTDAGSGLMWTASDSGEALDWESALTMASEANEQQYLGYSDWRVPNVKELQSIVDYSGSYPALDADFFEVTEDDAYFWTSTSAYFNTQDPTYYYAWYVAFGYAVDGEGNDSHGAGAVRFDTKEEGGPAGEDPERVYNYVRLVRDA